VRSAHAIALSGQIEFLWLGNALAQLGNVFFAERRRFPIFQLFFGILLGGGLQNNLPAEDDHGNAEA
jgi:hypothetical protein